MRKISPWRNDSSARSLRPHRRWQTGAELPHPVCAPSLRCGFSGIVTRRDPAGLFRLQVPCSWIGADAAQERRWSSSIRNWVRGRGVGLPSAQPLLPKAKADEEAWTEYRLEIQDSLGRMSASGGGSIVRSNLERPDDPSDPSLPKPAPA